MAGGLINYQSRRAGGKQAGRARFRPMAEINVTPFVDVMLVLLIIFMVTAPLMTVGVPVDLPQTRAAQLNDSDEPLVVTMKDDGSLHLQESEVALGDLAARLAAVSGQNAEIRIFVRADKRLAYGEVMALMGEITQAGFRRVALLAEAPN